MRMRKVLQRQSAGGGKWRRPEKGTVVGGDGGRLGQGVSRLYDLREGRCRPRRGVAHINRYNTGHSEAIITENYTNAQRFLDEIDAACVYVNASTRFQTDLNLDWRGDRHQYPEASCKRTDGTGCADQHKIYYIWKRADTSVDGKDEDEKENRH